MSQIHVLLNTKPVHQIVGQYGVVGEFRFTYDADCARVIEEEIVDYRGPVGCDAVGTAVLLKLESEFGLGREKGKEQEGRSAYARVPYECVAAAIVGVGGVVGSEVVFLREIVRKWRDGGYDIVRLTAAQYSSKYAK